MKWARLKKTAPKGFWQIWPDGNVPINSVFPYKGNYYVNTDAITRAQIEMFCKATSLDLWRAMSKVGRHLAVTAVLVVFRQNMPLNEDHVDAIASDDVEEMAVLLGVNPSDIE